ncbi:MAG: transketolase, partial [Elusimicrobiota bacterium]|nr:transketolase [Elusimicrobiota bacterium]
MMRELVKALYELAQKDKNVIWLSADSGGEFDILFYRDFPNQYFNVGIAEENMIGIASGLSSYGMVPYGSSSSSFLAYRAFEFIRDDICFQQKNVKIYGFASGVSFSRLGPTHHATEDISILRTLPHLTILSPASPKEA